MSQVQSKRVSRLCEYCRKPFFIYQRYGKRPDQRFCGKECFRVGRRVPLMDRLFDRIGRKNSTGCILWNGTHSDGRPVIGVGRRTDGVRVVTHVTYEWAYGTPVSPGLFPCHTCDNPACINPAHLFLGGIPENHADMVAKNRQAKGESFPQSKLTADIVRDIRRRHKLGGVTYRQLAAELGVSWKTIEKAITRATWKHVA